MSELKCITVETRFVPVVIPCLCVGDGFSVALPCKDGYVTVRNDRSRASYSLKSGRAAIPEGTVAEGEYTIGFKSDVSAPSVPICRAVCVDDRILFVSDLGWLSGICEKLQAQAEKVAALEKSYVALEAKVFGFKLF